MPAVAALLDHRAALGALRRSLPRGAGTVVACRSGTGLARVLQGRLVEAVVLGGKVARRFEVGAFRQRYPGIPVVVYGMFRSEDAPLLLDWHRLGVAAVAVEGVDDPVLGDTVARVAVSARRRAALADLPRLLRLTEPLQRAAWLLLLEGPGRPARTAGVARQLGLSREHLSRQFGAGGAPNLKRVSDLLSVIATLGLLRNPGYDIAAAARLLGFSTPSHLRVVIRRVTALSPAEALRLEEREVVARFLRAERRVGG